KPYHHSGPHGSRSSTDGGLWSVSEVLPPAPRDHPTRNRPAKSGRRADCIPTGRGTYATYLPESPYWADPPPPRYSASSASCACLPTRSHLRPPAFLRSLPLRHKPHEMFQQSPWYFRRDPLPN